MRHSFRLDLQRISLSRSCLELLFERLVLAPELLAFLIPSSQGIAKFSLTLVECILYGLLGG
jgi:hypothetical protein